MIKSVIRQSWWYDDDYAGWEWLIWHDDDETDAHSIRYDDRDQSSLWCHEIPTRPWSYKDIHMLIHLLFTPITRFSQLICKIAFYVVYLQLGNAATYFGTMQTIHYSAGIFLDSACCCCVMRTEHTRRLGVSYD